MDDAPGVARSLAELPAPAVETPGPGAGTDGGVLGGCGDVAQIGAGIGTAAEQGEEAQMPMPAAPGVVRWRE